MQIIIERLSGEQARRIVMIREINALDNRAAARVRRYLGWQYDMPEAERGKLNARAKVIVMALYAGKPVKAADTEVAALMAGEIEVFRQAREPLVKFRENAEKTMRKLAAQLPAYVWVESVRGFGDLAFAVIVAEAGDLANYPDRHRLWKRFGLTPHAGQAASTWRRKGGLDAEGWTALGYKPARNAESYAVLGDPLFRQQSMIEGPYRGVYDREKARFLADGKTKLHSHMHGLRCMRKAALEDLWRAWNGHPPKERPMLDHCRHTDPAICPLPSTEQERAGGGQHKRTDGLARPTPAGAAEMPTAA